jgi:hypothetical protein
MWLDRRRLATRAASLVGVVVEVLPGGAMTGGGSPGSSRLVLETLDLEIWCSGVAFSDLFAPSRAGSGRGRPCSAAISLGISLAARLLVGFGVADLAGCRRVARGLPARFE